MFENVGASIKRLAKFICYLGIIGSIISGVVMLVNASEMRYGGEIYTFLGIATLIVGPITAWLSTVVLYAFGELVDKVCGIQSDVSDIKRFSRLTLTTVEEYTEENKTEQNSDSSQQWLCPKCDKTISSYPCYACGYDATRKEKPVVSSENGMWKCKNCNSRNLLKSEKCWNCGKTIDSSDDIVAE